VASSPQASVPRVPLAASPSAERRSLLLSILLGLVSAVLLDFCFPVAGPMPPWRGLLAFIALVPLLYALLHERTAAHPRYLRRAALTAYLSGVLWYILNCYWIYQTMLYYGHVPPLGSAGIVLLYSLILGLYFGLFGLLLAFFRRRFGVATALILAPFLWTAIELAAARITSVPWDQLGYSQVDSIALTQIAPWTGVYGISWILLAVSSSITAILLPSRRPAWSTAAGFVFIAVSVLASSGSFLSTPAPTNHYAVLLQPNIDVEPPDNWQGPQWDGNPNWILTQSQLTCTPAYPGMPPAHDDPGAPPPTPPTPPNCAQNTPPPGLILWPEVASWFRSNNPQTQSLLAAIATTNHAPVVAGMVGVDPSGIYNSAVFVQPDGTTAGRYDKIHLVPFGEYVPFRNLFFFAHHLTNQVGDFNRGAQRKVFTAATPGDPTYGIFICYESVFADEIRHFALNGAQVLVNISDDGWYGDTSAPWQHLNMARMRAIENRRWLLRDTNNGVTTVIDPYGRVTQSAPRHTVTTLVARYGTRSDLTFYTRHGDLFAYLCCLAVLAALACGLLRRPSAAS
jgi:apolipoprotein N-acyltransferase